MTISLKRDKDVKVRVITWEHVPDAEDEQPCFLRYRITGLIWKPNTNGQLPAVGTPFSGIVEWEIDGRDGGYEPSAGPNLDVQVDQDAWDALIAVLDETPGLMEDSAQRTESYYNG